MNILIVEDNADIVANLYAFLEPMGYRLDTARNGITGLTLATEGHYDALVLDLTLPGLDGLELARRLRRDFRRSTPILMLTARDSVQDKVEGFDSGGDDYLVKPFSLVELEARLKALVRRAKGAQVAQVMRYADLSFDAGTFEARRADVRLQLTPTGYKLLAALLRAAPRIVSREALEQEVWGDDRPDSDALRTHIHALRLALDRPFLRPLLKTQPGVGYRLVDGDD